MEKHLPAVKGQNALQALAARLQVDPVEMQKTLKATAFKACTTSEQFLAAVIVANTYNLNPLLREIYAFPGKSGDVVPVVPIDGWVSLVNRQPDFDGVELVENEDDKGGLVSVTAKFYSKGRAHPVVVTEYMAECCQDNKEPWKRWPRRMLRHKAYIQGARIAYGLHGIFDEDEAERIREAEDARPGKSIVQMPRAIEEAADTGAVAHEQAGQSAAAEPPAQEPRPQSPGRKITEPQAKRMYAIASKRGISKERVADLLTSYGYNQGFDILMSDYDAIVSAIERMSADERDQGQDG